ncbi:MAG: GGDEF domain-containing protein [Treponema sp.]|jgi:diguanylate cyclase (GGDEF)-like protein|nr:GGDEF domain-containing protein [Treponema sp.]
MTEVSDVLDHIRRLLKDNAVPGLDGELAELPVLREIHDDIKGIREIVYSFAAGDLSPAITIRGIIPGCLKTLQAHLRHMIWQVQMVEQGDFTQQVQFMGEFSSAFNNMVGQLDTTLKELKAKELDLRALADSLRKEINLRNTAVEALQESESRFKYLASHDPLTGALNRRSFMERAEYELRAARTLGISSGIVMMDIDHFKIFNDTYGHQAGDDALRHVVTIIASMLRKNDFLGRYGGEEFMFFFSHADKKTGVGIAERVREAIASSPVKIGAGLVPISASFGVILTEDADLPALEPQDAGKRDAAEAGKNGEGVFEYLIRCADLALYQAKEGGRNRVVCYEKGTAAEIQEAAEIRAKAQAAAETQKERKRKKEKIPEAVPSK